MGKIADWFFGAAPEAPVENRYEGAVYLPATLPSSLLPPPRWDSEPVSVDTALTIPDVYRAVSIITGATQQLTLDVWRGTDQISAPAWVRRPDMKTSRSQFLADTTASLALAGEAFWQVVRDTPTDAPTALIVLNPFQVSINDDGTYNYGTRSTPFRAWEIEHLTLFKAPGAKRGLGPIQAARASLTGALDLRSYAGKFFTESGAVSGVLKSDQHLTAEQAEAYKQQWEARAYGTAVLGAGLDYTPILLPPADVQFLESRNFTSRELARLFGIPARLMLVDAGSSMDYANQQEADLNFLRFTLMQYLRPIEEAFSNLLPRTSTARFNVDAFLRPATKARYEAHEIALRAGFLTKDEVRALEGLPPLPEQPSITPEPASVNQEGNNE